ncbi:hypothetical protein [Streptomyces vinaceus]|uniref:hypothetical protein n=1 Tax=Streptomyces vinaceus TaxID=1960 RepID=UPI00123E4953|nr:hypothetical protein [Streptomyces vinaceus]GHE31151.1 hypothetical protein GCM10017778_11970 [Streptomyces vinaceus]
MALQLAPLLGTAGVVIAAAAGPLVTGAVQNRRDARLAADLTRNLDLLEKLRGYEAGTWDAEVHQLDVLVRIQLAAAAARQKTYVEQRRSWSNLGAVLMVLSIALPLLWLLTLPGSWWSWVIFTLLLILTLILCGIGLHQTFRPPADAPLDAAAA